MVKKRSYLRFEVQKGAFKYILDVFKGLPIILEVIGINGTVCVYTICSKKEHSKEEEQEFKDRFANFSNMLLRNKPISSFKSLYDNVKKDSIYFIILNSIIKGRLNDIEKQMKELEEEKENIIRYF